MYVFAQDLPPFVANFVGNFDEHWMPVDKGYRQSWRHRAKTSSGTEEAERPKPSKATQWVKSHPVKLATAGSEFCVVVSNGGTKRKQPVLKLCDRASKDLRLFEALLVVA